MSVVLHALILGLEQALGFFWDSLFGLIFGFLISAVAQTALTPSAMQRLLGPNLRGILSGLGLGIIASSCSYGAAAAVRGFYRSGADVRSIFAFLISSTNMNVAIVILFWSLLGWKFAFAEFFGGIIIDILQHRTIGTASRGVYRGEPGRSIRPPRPLPRPRRR
jgi:uncharacterized membrane protein YraQ (UPF0718 family)